MSKSIKQKQEGLKNDLFSDNEEVVMKALLRCRDEGNASMVEPLLVLYSTTDMPEVKKDVANILETLKVSKVEDIFLSALAREEMRHIKSDIISFMWNAGLQPVKAIADISRIAASGSYQEAFECLTLLESIEDAVPEEILLESIELIKLQLTKNIEAPMRVLLIEYLKTLEELRFVTGENI